MHLQYATASNQPARISGKLDSGLERISDCIIQPVELQQQAAISDWSGSWTYAQLAEATSDIESWLIYQGIRAGDRVVIVSENCRLFIAILFALSRIDAWPVLMTAGVSPQELDQLLLALCPIRRELYIIAGSGDAHLHAMRHRASFINPVDWGPIAIGALNDGAEPEPVESGIPSRVAAEVCWFDRAGQLRSEKFTHRNLLFVAAACAGISGRSSGNPVHCALPISDIFGLSGVLLPGLLSGGTVHLSRQLEPATYLRSSIH